MGDLRWSWLALPYLVCTAVVVILAVAAAIVRGDRVLRLGVIGAAITSVPWTLCQAIAALTEDPEVALRVLRLGHGPVALIGPNLLLVLLGLSGQLERFRWLLRVSGGIAIALLVACWTTELVVPRVALIPSGMYYIMPGPLTGPPLWLLIGSLVVGIIIARRAAPEGDRRRAIQLLMGVLGFMAVGSLDTLLLYRIWGYFPVAWLCAMAAAGIGIYLVLRTNLLRPRGYDRDVALELVVHVVAYVAIAILAWQVESLLAVAALGAVVWTVATGVAWAVAAARPVVIAGERELEQFVAGVAAVDNERVIGERLATLWRSAIGVELQTLWWRDGDDMVSAAGNRRAIDRDVARWLVRYGRALAMVDFATMRVGAIRGKLEALGAQRGSGLIVPLVDRDELVGLVDARYEFALRDEERVLLADSARAAARALTFAAMARAAARERETAREVEIADALRLQASASRDAQLGRWTVAAEYRSAPRTTGAGWSATELGDGRLALLVTEAQAHGVAAALATAALSGAFAAATAGRSRLTLDELVRALGASSEGVMRGGEPVAAFLAILDGGNHTIDYACAGHPGAFLVSTKITPLGAGARDPGASLVGATRRSATLPDDALVVVASSALKSKDIAEWRALLGERSLAPVALAPALVEAALARGASGEDLLAVVVQQR